MRLTMETRTDRKGREYYFIKPSPYTDMEFHSLVSATVFPHPNAHGYAVYIWWQKREYIMPETVDGALGEATGKAAPHWKYRRWVKRYLVGARERTDIWTDTSGTVHVSTHMYLQPYHAGVATRTLDKVMNMVSQGLERWSSEAEDWYDGWASR